MGFRRNDLLPYESIITMRNMILNFQLTNVESKVYSTSEIFEI